MAFRSRVAAHPVSPSHPAPILIHCGLGDMTLSIKLNDILVSERAIL